MQQQQEQLRVLRQHAETIGDSVMQLNEALQLAEQRRRQQTAYINRLEEKLPTNAPCSAPACKFKRT